MATPSITQLQADFQAKLQASTGAATPPMWHLVGGSGPGNGTTPATLLQFPEDGTVTIYYDYLGSAPLQAFVQTAAGKQPLQASANTPNVLQVKAGDNLIYEYDTKQTAVFLAYYY